MADNTDQRLAEIEANKKAQRIADAKKAAKLKAAKEKADADRKKREQDIAKVAQENSQQRGAPVVEKRLNPQTESGKYAQQNQRIERENKTNLSNKYGQAYRKREDLIEKYSKTGDPRDKQLALDAQAALEPIVAEYIKVFGTEPPGYKPATNLSETAGRTENQQRQGEKKLPTVSEAQSRKVVSELAGRNGAPSVAVSAIAQSADPNVQSIINAAAKNGIQLSLADAVTAAGGGNTGGGGGGGGRSMASTTSQTTQYTMQQVRAAADNIYQNSIGRVLNDDELRMLHQSLNNTLKSSPTVTKTSASGNSVTTGGVDERGFMQQQAEANPEFASYQKATTYFDAMLGSLQGPVGGGI